MLSHLKKRLGVLTAIAVVAALIPALMASPASAAASTTTVYMDDVAELSACPTQSSIPAAGFTDTTSTDVDCIKYYGITTGVTATTYEPAGTVTRETMALFLSRLADVSGITLGSGADQGFTDLPTSAASQTAINQIKQLGVTVGKTATTFAPDDNVTREEMAMFMERLAAATTAGPGGTSDATAAGTATTYINNTDTDYNFADIDSGTVTYEGHNAIIELWQMGVTDLSHGAAAYRPSADITRAEMATFMTNFLGHTNARPTGLTIQASSVTDWGSMVAGTDELHVSNRDANFDGIANTIVDVFGYKTVTTVGEAAFSSTGACKDALEADSSGAEELCVMEAGDYATNQSGNIAIEAGDLATTVSASTEGNVVQYWAWSGAVGTYYNDNTTTGASTVTVTSKKDGDTAQWSRTDPYASSATYSSYDGTNDLVCLDGKMGSDVTYTFQMATIAGATGVSVAKAGVKINVNTQSGTGGAVSSAQTNTVITTDADGTATFTATMADPAVASGSIKWAKYSFSDGSNTLVTAIGDFTTSSARTTGSTWQCIKWQDTARATTTALAAVSNSYVSATATGTGAAGTVTATVLDQYGVGVASESVRLTSADTGTGSGTASTYSTTRTTNSSGQASFGTLRDAATSAKSTYTAQATSDGSGISATAVQYWVIAPSATSLDGGSAAAAAPQAFQPQAAYGTETADGEFSGKIVIMDAANDTFVVDISYWSAGDAASQEYVKYTYDSNDAFFIAGAAKTYAAFDYAQSIKSATNLVLTAADALYDASNNGKLATDGVAGNASEWRLVD